MYESYDRGESYIETLVFEPNGTFYSSEQWDHALATESGVFMACVKILFHNNDTAVEFRCSFAQKCPDEGCYTPPTPPPREETPSSADTPSEPTSDSTPAPSSTPSKSTDTPIEPDATTSASGMYFPD